MPQLNPNTRLTTGRWLNTYSVAVHTVQSGSLACMSQSNKHKNTNVNIEELLSTVLLFSTVYNSIQMYTLNTTGPTAGNLVKNCHHEKCANIVFLKSRLVF